MYQNQATTEASGNPSTNRAPFTNKFKITELSLVALPVSEPKIFAHCDVCSKFESDTADALEASGWGLYGNEFQFCPIHEAMV